MKRKQLKFAIGSVVIILTLSYLAYSGFQESKTYYHTVPELYSMKDSAYDVRLQVSGDVVPGSIQRDGKVVNFVMGVICLMIGSTLMWVATHSTDAATPWGVWQQIIDAIGKV